MTRVRAGMVALVGLAITFGAGCGRSSSTEVATHDEPAIWLPATTPLTTYPAETDEPQPTVTLPPGKIQCTIFYGTLLPGEEKDVPVYRTDSPVLEQIATIHLPSGVWTPAEANELCA